MARTELIQWVEDGSRPDAAETILFTLSDGDVVQGYFDGEAFCTNFREYDSDEVVAWAKWPEGARA